QKIGAWRPIVSRFPDSEQATGAQRGAPVPGGEDPLRGPDLEVRTGRQVAALVATRLLVASIERVVLDVAHVGQAKPGERLLGDRVLIAVRVFGGAADGMGQVPVPVIDGPRELGVLPVAPGALAATHDGRAQYADRMLTDHRTMRVSAWRVRLESRRRRAWRHLALLVPLVPLMSFVSFVAVVSFMSFVAFVPLMSFMSFVVLAALLGARDGGGVEPGERQHEREWGAELGGELHGGSPGVG